MSPSDRKSVRLASALCAMALALAQLAAITLGVLVGLQVVAGALRLLMGQP